MFETATISSKTQVPSENDLAPASMPVTGESRQGALPVQCKLSIGAVDDPMEAEAEAMADRVMRMPETAVQRKCAHCEEEEQAQRKPMSAFIQKMGNGGGGVASEAISRQINESKGNGSSMDTETKSFMENRFGTDFSDVKIHTGSQSHPAFRRTECTRPLRPAVISTLTRKI